jgi:hypothetical protein
MYDPEMPPHPDAVLAAAARHFAATWAELARDLPDDYDCHMTCGEADAMAGLLRSAGHKTAGDSVLAGHAAHDVPGDGHYSHKFTDGVCTECRIPFAVATGVCPGPLPA